MAKKSPFSLLPLPQSTQLKCLHGYYSKDKTWFCDINDTLCQHAKPHAELCNCKIACSKAHSSACTPYDPFEKALREALNG